MSAPETRTMTEDDLLLGITDALTIAGWTWTHARRSDQARLMGSSGVPDLIAVSEHRRTLLAWELKAATGRPTYEQVAWLRGLGAVRTVDARLVYPKDYDAAVSQILRGDVPGLRCVVCGRETEVCPLNPDTLQGLCRDHDPST